MNGLNSKTGDTTLFIFEDWELKGTATTAKELKDALMALHVA
jgi:hypothetical protein